MGTVNRALLEAASTGFTAIFNEVFEAMKEGEFWSKVATKITSTGEKEEYDWLGDIPLVREWIGDRMLEDLRAYQYTLTNQDWEDTIEVLRNSLEDDKLGIYAPKIRMLVQRMMQHKDKLCGALLTGGFAAECYDGQFFFDTDHEINGASVSNDGSGSSTNWFVLVTTQPIKPLIMQVRKEPEFVAMDKPDDENAFMRKKYRYGCDGRYTAGYGLWQMSYGSKDTLDGANLQTAITAIKSFTDNKGEPLGLIPDTLVVPPSLEFTASKLLNNDVISDGLGGWDTNETKGALPNLIVSAWVI